MDSTIIIADAADRRIKAFSYAGKFMWAFGRAGNGPNEFAAISDLKVAPDGTVWVNDPANARITVLDRDGRALRAVRTTASLHRVIPLRDSSYLGYSGSATTLVHYSVIGQRLATLPEPAFLHGVNPRAAEPVYASLPSGNIIGAFRWSNYLLQVTSTGAPVWATPGIEPRPFPDFNTMRVKVDRRPVEVGRVSATATVSTADLGLGSTALYILLVSRAEDGNALVDSYDLKTGAYLKSYVLPVPIIAMEFLNGVAVTLVYDPYPAVVLMRPPKS